VQGPGHAALPRRKKEGKVARSPWIANPGRQRCCDVRMPALAVSQSILCAASAAGGASHPRRTPSVYPDPDRQSSGVARIVTSNSTGWPNIPRRYCGSDRTSLWHSWDQRWHPPTSSPQAPRGVSGPGRFERWGSHRLLADRQDPHVRQEAVSGGDGVPRGLTGEASSAPPRRSALAHPQLQLPLGLWRPRLRWET